MRGDDATLDFRYGGRPAGYPVTMIGFIVAGLVIGALGP
jgi:hypothetical protein